MQKSDLCLVLCLFASNDDQVVFAKQQAVKYLIDKGVIVEINDGEDLHIPIETVKALKEEFNISFEGEN